MIRSMIDLTEDEWKKRLNSEQYQVMRQKGTEAPFSSPALEKNGDGNYTCAACGVNLFKSDTLYESDIPGLAGWPSFADVADSGTIRLTPDNSHGMERTEVTCANCGSHLGHLFPDESSPSGQHYCINAVALEFSKKL
ncbi:MAG: peptide-methionine (R)-S-oxide reductase MsrB [Candidatus Saccharimonadales bacterium]